MEPLNWEFGVRCDRPFSNVRAIHPKPLPSLKRMSVPTGQDVPTKYFLDQQKFWEAEPGDDPNPHPNDLDDHLVESEPLQFWWEALTALLEVVWLFGSAILLLFWNVLKMMVPLVVVSWQWIADRVGWEAIVALLMASQAMSFLPGFDRTIGRADMGGEAWKSSAPLYVIMIPNFHQMSRLYPPYVPRNLLILCSEGSCTSVGLVRGFRESVF